MLFLVNLCVWESMNRNTTISIDIL
jgi:hypothetical protein